jgi:lipoate-protein ligase A
MLFVDNENTTDPHLNLAIEEHLLRYTALEQDLLLLYINEPSLIIGRNQNILEEVNRVFVETYHIPVVRRLSGGGTVYHDLGNLNYSFIARSGKEDAVNFKKFTAPVIQALRQMGLPAELGSRNEFLVAGKKISGNAIYSTPQGIVCHGTLLFNTDLDRLNESINVKPEKIVSKGVKSVRSQVVNISEHLTQSMDIFTFRQRLISTIFEGQHPLPQYTLTPQDWASIQTLAAQRYHSWEWTYGRTPTFTLHKSQLFSFGQLDAQIDVRDGIIQTIQFSGDFFGYEDIHLLEQKMVGLRYDHYNLEQALRTLDTDRYIIDLGFQDLLNFIY